MDPVITSIFRKYANPGALSYTWVFDPQSDSVDLFENDDEAPTHAELADNYPHPHRIHGYAYRIVGGWRITDWEHKPIADPHVVKLVRDELIPHENPTTGS